jgi:hypothetical protein
VQSSAWNWASNSACEAALPANGTTNTESIASAGEPAIRLDLEFRAAQAGQ